MGDTNCKIYIGCPSLRTCTFQFAYTSVCAVKRLLQCM